MHKGGGRECFSGICVMAIKLIKMQPLQIGQYSTVNVRFLMDYKKKKTHDRCFDSAAPFFSL